MNLNATCVDTLDNFFLQKADLASLKTAADKLEKVPSALNSLKSKLDELDFDKLKPALLDLKY